MEAPGRAVPAGSKSFLRRPLLGWALLGVVLWVCPAPSFAGAPTEQIRGTIDRAIEILKEPSLATKGKKEERRLGPNWRGRTPEERDRFVALFRELLENSYLGKIEAYQGEVIRYDKEKVDGPYAEGRTPVVTRKGQEHPGDYRKLR